MSIFTKGRGQVDINNLALNILRRMPADLTQIEQARYIYLQLGKLVTFDEKYWLGNSRTRQRIYKSARKVQDFKDMKDNKVICVSLSNLYNGLLRKFGIEAEAVRAEDGIHVYTIFQIDGIEYEADLQRDLKFIQAHRRTRSFGTEPDYSSHKLITDKQLQQIDEKLGYTYEGEEAFSILVSRIKERLKSILGIEQKLKYVLNQIAEYQSELDLGYTERMLCYELVLADVFSSKDTGKVELMDMYVEKDGERKYTCCASANVQKNLYTRFMYSEKTGCFLPISDEELLKLMEDGLRTIANRKIKGLQKANSKPQKAEESIEK